MTSITTEAGSPGVDGAKDQTAGLLDRDPSTIHDLALISDDAPSTPHSHHGELKRQRPSPASSMPPTSFPQGRVFLPGHPTINPMEMKSRFKTFRVLSYNILAQANVFECLSYAPPTAVLWERRRALIMQELRAYDAHVICLQDVDHYEHYWRNELDDLGYDR